MGNLIIALAAAAAVAADPFVTMLDQSDGKICFTRSYDSAWLEAHKGQRVRDVRFAVTASRGSGRPMMRLKLDGLGAPLYAYGECSWYAGDLNRGVDGGILDTSFKGDTGVGCHLYTDVDGVSAEEGGDFPAEWVDGGAAIQLHLPDSVAGWRSLDVSRYAGFHDLGPADRIVRLKRAPISACSELIERFASKADMDNI